MEGKPTIVMVPGAWHKASIYSSVSSILNTHGYPTICLDLPFAGATPPHTSFDHDVSTIRECLTSLVSSNKDVVPVAWSYGGFPSGEAPKGLSNRDRITQGLKGGVIRFVVTNGVAMPAGHQPHAPGEYGSMPEWIEKDISNNIGTILPSTAKQIFYHDLPASQAEELSAKLVHQSLGLFFSTSTYAAFTDIPSTFLSSGNDRTPFGS
ncbi:hypothetical protein BGZ57DRAFT_869248 [Hyaloscypha finlandica]|nr:hypothetical protein BGZ57DRAFT_869248 [Hyaloscypha finlandica]